MTIRTITTDQTILAASAGQHVPINTAPVKDSDLSFVDEHFVAKEDGDYDVRGQLRHSLSANWTQLAVKNPSTDEVFVLGQGEGSRDLGGSRIIPLKAGQRLRLYFMHGGEPAIDTVLNGYGIVTAQFSFHRVP